VLSDLEGVGDGQDPRVGVVGEPVLRGVGAGEEVDLVAEGGTDRRRSVGGDQGDDGRGRLYVGGPVGGGGEADRLAGGAAG